MSEKVPDLVFFDTPEVEYASNYFRNVPVILQYDDQPLIEVVQEINVGFTTQFSIYNKDGIYLAKVTGTQIYRTEDGEKMSLNLRHPDLMTVCELEGKTLFEVRRAGAAALKMDAELYAPDGRFLKKADSGIPSELISADGSFLRIQQLTMIGSHFENCRIGIHVRSDGKIGIGGS
jgi:hypothetical protein